MTALLYSGWKDALMLYPEIEPYEHGLLDVGDGHEIYWETCGNPDGKPALVVHGGPGTGCSANLRRYFDPARYRVVLVDQRGCGRSTPHAGAPVADLSANTTDHLVADFELLRTRLGIEKWLLFGGSWGSVLGLTYALRHTGRVSEMVLMGLATDRFIEIEMLIRGLGAYFPEAFEKFRHGVPEAERDDDLSAAYNRLLMDPDPEVHHKAADDWCAWEDAMLPGVPAARSPSRTRPSSSASPGWSRTTSATGPSCPTAKSCATSASSPASPPCWPKVCSTRATWSARPG